jgi:hypothetical protein
MFSEVDVSPLPLLRNGDPDLETLATDSLTVPSDIPVSELVDRFREENRERASIVDTDGERCRSRDPSNALKAIAGDIEEPPD